MPLHKKSAAENPLSPRSARAGLLGLTVLLLRPLCAPARESADRIQFEISPGPAQKSLLEFGAQSHLNIWFSEDEVQGIYTNAVTEFLEPRGALSQLLERTLLCAFFSSTGKSVSVKLCKPTDEPANPTSSLDVGAGAAATVETPQIETVRIVGQSITGTNIRGVRPPVLVVTRKDFQLHGIRTTAELFAQLPELTGGTPAGARALGNSSLGVAINLRGQGAAATLVLLNGRRLAGSGDQGAFQDAANIPLSAIARVEVSLDGASAQYGSDAVGGVVNIITLSGDQRSLFSAQQDHGIGSPFEQTDLSQVVGHEWDSGTGVITAEYIHATPWKGPNLVVPQTSTVVDRVPGKEMGSAYGHIQQTLPWKTELTAEGIFTHRREEETYDTALAPTVPNGVVSQKTGVSVQMTHLALESKTALTENDLLALSLSRATETERQRIWPVSPIELTDGATEPASSSVVPPTWFSMFSRLDQATLKFDGLISPCPAGDLKGAIGAEYRHQTLNTLDNTSSPEFPSRYARDVLASFAELNIPIAGNRWSVRGIRQLELSVAGRYEKNSDFKYHFIPQSWLRWVPRPGLELRASWGHSYQAPLLPNLDTSRNATVLSPVTDSASPTGHSEVLLLSGNNSDLTPETATTEGLNARFDWPISPGTYLNTELDYFRIHFYDRIQSPDLSQIDISDPAYAPLVDRTLGNRTQLCASPQFYGNLSNCLTDPIAAIVDLRLNNIDSLSTQGLEMHTDWGTNLAATRVEVDIRGTYFFQFAERITPAAPAVSLLRTENSPAVLQLSSFLSLQFGNTQLHAIVHFLNGFRDNSSQPAVVIAPWTTVDLGAQYDLPAHVEGILKNSTIVISVRNITDSPMPLLNDASVNQSYDLLGGLAVRRVLSVGVLKRL